MAGTRELVLPLRLISSSIGQWPRSRSLRSFTQRATGPMIYLSKCEHHDLPIPHFPRPLLVRRTPSANGPCMLRSMATRRPTSSSSGAASQASRRPFTSPRLARRSSSSRRTASATARRPQRRSARHRQRAGPEEMEAEFGFERAKALFDLAEEAKSHVIDFAAANGIGIDFTPGHLNVTHKKRELPEYEALCRSAPSFRLSACERDERCRDSRAGRLDALLRRRARHGHRPHPSDEAACGHGARGGRGLAQKLYENTRATDVSTNGGQVTVKTATGTIRAKKALLAIDAYAGDLEKDTPSHIMPIGSFIGATFPCKDSPVLPGGESVSDSRFVVRYFPPRPTGELLFGGRERSTRSRIPTTSTSTSAGRSPRPIRRSRTSRSPMAGAAMSASPCPEKPYIRGVMPNVISAGGYSGHGVMLSNFVGKLYAEAVSGNRDRLKLFEALDVPAFPGGDRLRAPICSWRSTGMRSGTGF